VSVYFLPFSLPFYDGPKVRQFFAKVSLFRWHISRLMVSERQGANCMVFKRFTLRTAVFVPDSGPCKVRHFSVGDDRRRQGTLGDCGGRPGAASDCGLRRVTAGTMNPINSIS